MDDDQSEAGRATRIRSGGWFLFGVLAGIVVGVVAVKAWLH